MSYHKLLSKQISKLLPESLQENNDIAKFLNAIDFSYKALERDRELAERAFSITEEEYNDINRKLKREVEVKKLSVEKLKEVVGNVSGIELQNDSEDLLAIARYLNQQVNKRKNAEEVFTSLIKNMNSGILLEDENRKIVFTNQVFCNLLNIPQAPELLQGMDCSQSAEMSKTLFQNPEIFVADIKHILLEKKLVTGNILHLANGSIYQRDYIPIFIDDKYKGHLWSYTDITEKKKSQDAIEQSELKNRLIMNAALDAIITIDMEGLITFWNPQAEHIFGWTFDEVVGKNLSETIIPVAFRAAHMRGLLDYTETGNANILNKEIELNAIHRDGKEFPIELYIIPVKQRENEFFCTFIRDISDRKKNEQDLHRLSLVAKGNQNGVLFTKPDGEITWTNEGFCKLTGFSPVEILGKTPIELCRGPLTDSDTLHKVVDSFFKGIAFSIEVIYYRKDGSWFWGRSTSQPIRNNKGYITEYFGIIEDITEERAVQQKIKEYEYRLKMALTNLGDNYWEQDCKTGKTYFSNPDNNLLGFRSDDVTDAATLWRERIYPDDQKIPLENNEKYSAGIIDHHECEYRMIHNDGSIRWVLDRGVVTELDENKHPLRIIGTHIDITRQKQLELELIQAKDAAEGSTKAKELFLANMSHEIRTPMNAIMGMANQLNKTNLNSNQQFYLTTIQSATDSLLTIINDILDLSKIEAGKVTLEKLGFESKIAISRAMQVMVHKAEEKGLSFTHSYCDSKIAPVLIGDPYRLNQVLLNLISNAIKFTEKGGVDIKCHLMEERDNVQFIETTVTDTGIGMDETFSKNLFQKFKQEDESVTRRFGGTGLGMSICKELVELMGGNIIVHSKKGLGTSISFTIPFSKGTEINLPVTTSEEIDTLILSGKNVLVTDDNEMNRLVASTILENYGMQVEEAQNGVEAIQKLTDGKFDIVLMDVQMPIMDGLEATREIRMKIDADIPIIALTALALKGDSEKFMAAG